MRGLIDLIKNGIGVVLLVCYGNFVLAESPPYFPTDVALGGKGEIIFTHKGKSSLDIFSANGETLLNAYTIDASPTGLTVDGNKAYVTTFGTEGHLQILSLESGKVDISIPTGSGAAFPTLSPDKSKVYVANQFQNTVSEIDISQKKVSRTVSVLREPKSMVLSKDGRYLFVTNYLPAQRADVDIVTSCVSVIDVATFKKIKDIQLANGSNALRGICITPDGKYVYVSHNLGRFTVPTSQLQQGWMNTSAFSIIDVVSQEYMGAVLVDEPEKGAAGIWGIACTEDQLFIAHSGTHEVSVIDHKAMRKKFEDYPKKEDLNYDLAFLYGMRKRVKMEGNGPRSLILSGNKLIVPTYFSDVLNFIDINSTEVTSRSLNPERIENIAQQGERIFNDAEKCFQGWQSCNGCHPGDGRMDAMNWDLMNDGVGNSKNCKSLLFSHVTPPNMISGIRAEAELAVRAGFRLIQFFDITEEDAVLVDEYLKSLRPVPSPFLVNGDLSAKAKAGRKVFETLGCDKCHSGQYFTDMKMHRIGEDIEFEKGWDTPTLIEVWRTSPYLFDGRAATMEEVFEVHRHGIDKKLSKKDMEDLVEYVKSL